MSNCMRNIFYKRATTCHREVGAEDRGRELSEVVSGTEPDIFQESPLLSPKMFFPSFFVSLSPVLILGNGMSSFVNNEICNYIYANG